MTDENKVSEEIVETSKEKKTNTRKRRNTRSSKNQTIFKKSNLKINNLKDYYLGSIAPDVAKQIGTSRNESHFIFNTPTDIPNLKLFKLITMSYGSTPFQ